MSSFEREHVPEVLRGAVVARYRTIKGKKYGPYYFRVWQEKRRRYAKYVPLQDVPAVMAACQSYRDAKALSREWDTLAAAASQIGLTSLEDFMEELMEVGR